MSDDIDERPIMIDNIHHHPQQQAHQSHQPHPPHWDAVVLPPVPPRSNNPTQPQPQPPTPSVSVPALSTPGPGQHHPPDSSRRHLSASRSSSNSHHGQHSSDPYPKSSNKGGVRGRVTVVCAECKRLKLRCSRDRPCTSCVKRACVDRCRYRNDEQPLATGSSGEHRSIIPSSAPGDAVFRLVSINCIQCSNNGSKCDRREPCSHCLKHNVDCVYPGLAPLAAPAEASLIQALSRLTRLEARISELSLECDQCADLQLKCDGRGPCSWCVKRHSQAQSHQSHSGGVGRGSSQFDTASSSSLGLPPLQPGVGASIGCTYSGYSEQAQRQSLHSPQSSLHASTGSVSRDRSPYALRISSPPPPNSSHSTTTTGSNELHSRISAAENQVGQYMRTHSHSFSHGHSLSHGSSASMGSGVGFAGPGGPGGSTTSYNSASTLTPITPSHPSSLHHYAVSGSGNVPHSSYSSHPPQHQHQHQHHHSTSSRHSPSQYSPGTSNHHPQASLDQAQSNHHQSYHSQDSHRPRQPSLSNASVLLPPPTNHPNHPPSSTSPGPFAFGSSSSRHSKIPTPPGSGSSASAGAPPPPPAPINAAAAAAAAAASAGGAANSAGTKLPEISNILTLLSPAPSSSTTESGKTPHPLRTPVSGVTSSAGHGILNIGGASSIQHTQSDVRGTPTQRDSHEHFRRDSLSHSRGALPSPSRSISPPHDHHSSSRQSPDSRPSSSETRNLNNPNKPTLYSPSQHRRGISGSYMDDNGGKLSAPSSHVRTFSGVSAIRGDMEEDDDRAEMEVDEIDNDTDA